MKPLFVVITVSLLLTVAPAQGAPIERRSEDAEAIITVDPPNHHFAYSVWLYVDRQGRVQDIEIFMANGDRLEPHWKIAAEIKGAFSRWIFKPALDRYNRPIDSFVEYRYRPADR